MPQIVVKFKSSRNSKTISTLLIEFRNERLINRFIIFTGNLRSEGLIILDKIRSNDIKGRSFFRCRCPRGIFCRINLCTWWLSRRTLCFLNYEPEFTGRYEKRHESFI